MSAVEWYALGAFVTAVVTAIHHIVIDRGEDAISSALFGMLCGLIWPWWLFAIALAGVGSAIAGRRTP